MILENRVLLYRFFLPLMWLLTLWVMVKKTILGLFRIKPKINTMWFDGLGSNCARVKEYAGSWRAQDLVYNYFERHEKSFVDSFWFGVVNAQASRNRLKIVTRKMYKCGVYLARKSKPQEVRILSVACGSAQAVVEAIVMLKEEGIFAKALLTDIDESALQYAQHLARLYGIEDRVSVARIPALKIYRYSRDFQPNIIEMVGLMDYLSHKQAVHIVRQIYRSLEENGGFFVTSNVHKNPEQFFLKWVINWEMIYRSRDELVSVVTESGFRTFKVLYEPVGINGVVVATV